MSAVLAGVWGVCGVLWLVTAPGFLVSIAGAGNAEPGYGVGWAVSALSWLAFPVCVGVAIASLVGARPNPVLGLLPVVAVVLFGLGFPVQRLGIWWVGRRERRRPAVPPPPPLRLADETPPRWTRPDFEELGDDARRAVVVDAAERALAVWRAFLASTPGGSVSYAVPGRTGRGAPRQQITDVVAYRALTDVRRGRAAARPRQTAEMFDGHIAALRDGRLAVPYRAAHALEAVRALHALEFGPPPADRRESEWDLLEHAYAALP